MNIIDFYEEQPDHERVKATQRLRSFVDELIYYECEEDGTLDSDLFATHKEELIEFICTGHINQTAMQAHIKILQNQVDYLQSKVHNLSRDNLKSNPQ